ncbi:endolytic transglycosylase MltG [Moraxella nasibovis]|uniref:endolytic transglycosylase MltG n=1 Tax=Moraxella nasibovis TaxID=2904120 RepID=UPI0024100707|nr:endolytic transglycosylase MltG [Moraxella nasibovis]WFF38795.1 endolytic transglycosylase MltG [Moraxella nasibovis]
MAKTTKKPIKKTPLKKHKKSTTPKVIGLVLLALLVLWGVILYNTIFAKTDRGAQTLSVKKGDTYHGLLVKDRWQTSALSSSTATRLYLKLRARTPLQEGTYQIPANASLRQVVDILSQGAEVQLVKVQIIEGKTIKDLYQTIKNTDGVVLEVLTPRADGYSWADAMRDNEQVAAALGVPLVHGNLEGQFAPNTYFFEHGTSDKKILQKLYDTQKQVLDEAWASRDQGLPYKDKYEALIMASIIEKETGIADERWQVSSVFVNRLRQNMRLQTDPTIIYGLFDRYDGKIYRSNINEKTDYNTYQIDGLPPTPIALPSKASIEAAMHPADSDWLYFVATGNGGHKFSRTLAEHNQAVAEYRAVMAQKNQQ